MSQRTYEARLDDRAIIEDGPGAGQKLQECLEDIAVLMAKVEHRLYVELHVKGRELKEIKRKFLRDYGITARQFNSVAIILLNLPR